jgi:taurine dioxygenase
VTPLDVLPLTPSLGAEVRGVDLANLEPGGFEAIRAAFLEHHVLAFRDQKLTPEQQIAFGRRFGTLHVHPIVPHLDGHPEILPIVNLGKRRTVTETWHSDVSFERTPPMASGLYAIELPPVGGDTLFANQHLAWERLSEGMQALLAKLRAVHTGAGLGAALGKGEAWREHGQSHPVVRTHPETGRRALYVNPAFTAAFEGMTVAESQPLLRFLYEAGHAPDLCYRHRWLPGDLVLWDNRSVQHYAVHDHGDAPRTLHRVTVIGDEPR